MLRYGEENRAVSDDEDPFSGPIARPTTGRDRDKRKVRTASSSRQPLDFDGLCTEWENK
jgi:hypothetical protein